MASITRTSHRNRIERRQQRRGELRDQLLGVVEAQLERGGSYTEPSVERLLSEAGIARSTFYAHFDDKVDLLLALVEDVVQTLVEALSDWLELPATATYADFDAAIRRFVAAYVPHRVVLAAIAETAAYDERAAELFDGRLDFLAEQLTAHLAAGRRSGLVRHTVDPEPTARWVSWLLERGMHELTSGRSVADVDERVETLVRLLWNALYEQVER